MKEATHQADSVKWLTATKKKKKKHIQIEHTAVMWERSIYI